MNDGLASRPLHEIDPVQPYRPMTSITGPDEEEIRRLEVLGANQYRAVREIGPDQSAEFDARHPELAAIGERVAFIEAKPAFNYDRRSVNYGIPSWRYGSWLSTGDDPDQYRYVIVSVSEAIPVEKWPVRPAEDWKRDLLWKLYREAVVQGLAPCRMPTYVERTESSSYLGNGVRVQYASVVCLPLELAE